MDINGSLTSQIGTHPFLKAAEIVAKKMGLIEF